MKYSNLLAKSVIITTNSYAQYTMWIFDFENDKIIILRDATIIESNNNKRTSSSYSIPKIYIKNIEQD